ncbi:hypothetical protein HZ994_11205 [Akkermansiaceae bacterium]|nr:hypothetical protein HZ994_11205 [Akkermansiaceae bacterium]
MKTAIISYDLRNTKPGDNSRVKSALEEFRNTHATLQALNVLSAFPRWVNLELPDTTLVATIADPDITAAKIAGEIASVIQNTNATVGKIYVAFLNTDDDFLVNNN